MSTGLFEHYKAALRRGHMAALAGDLEAALDAYDEAVRLVPDRALPIASRGTVLHRLDRWPEAAESFDRALQLDPDDEAALRARATARAESGIGSGAAADFERLAFVLDVAGRAGDAADAARRAADLEPTPAREALADRLGGSAAGVMEAAWAAMADRATADPAAPLESELDTELPPAIQSEIPIEPGAGPQPETHVELGAYDALEALRAGFEAEERAAAADAARAASEGIAPTVEEADATAAEAPAAAAAGAAGANGTDGSNGADDTDHLDALEQTWPGIDLPSPPPPPVDAGLDPEEVLAEAALMLESGEAEAARDLMLTAARIHREAGRIDAALDVCLNLLSFAPGDPRVHLAIANLQLDRGWNAVATEKLDLLVRLTGLTGDTQAEADVHGLASERLRDDPAASAAGR